MPERGQAAETEAVSRQFQMSLFRREFLVVNLFELIPFEVDDRFSRGKFQCRSVMTHHLLAMPQISLLIRPFQDLLEIGNMILNSGVLISTHFSHNRKMVKQRCM